MTLARIGPVKPFRVKSLTAQSEACGRTERATLALAQRGSRRIDRNLGTHMEISAVSAEIVDGMLPEKRLRPRALCCNVPVQHARVGRKVARAAAQRTGRQAW